MWSSSVIYRLQCALFGFTLCINMHHFPVTRLPREHVLAFPASDVIQMISLVMRWKNVNCLRLGFSKCFVKEELWMEAIFLPTDVTNGEASRWLGWRKWALTLDQIVLVFSRNMQTRRRRRRKKKTGLCWHLFKSQRENKTFEAS